MKSVILFDWDGTLQNSQNAVLQTYSEVLGKPVEYVRENLNHDWKKFVRDEDIHISQEDWKGFMRKYGTSLFPGAKQYLQRTRNNAAKMGLATSTILLTVKEDLSRYKIDRIFDAVVTCEDVKNIKPDPACLKLSMKRLGANIKDCVFIGDTPEDAKAADAIDMDFVGVAWGYEPVKIRNASKRVASSFDELYDILNGL
jgi:pyrophosphatase PpaX